MRFWRKSEVLLPNAESEVLREMGKGRVELKLGVGSAEEKRFDEMAFGAGEGDVAESIMTAQARLILQTRRVVPDDVVSKEQQARRVVCVQVNYFMR